MGILKNQIHKNLVGNFMSKFAKSTLTSPGTSRVKVITAHILCLIDLGNPISVDMCVSEGCVFF